MPQSKQDHKPKKSGRPHGSVTQFPGISEAARLLGKSPYHLRLVLLGERNGFEIMSRLEELSHPILKFIPKSSN